MTLRRCVLPPTECTKTHSSLPSAQPSFANWPICNNGFWCRLFRRIHPPLRRHGRTSSGLLPNSYSSHSSPVIARILLFTPSRVLTAAYFNAALFLLIPIVSNRLLSSTILNHFFPILCGALAIIDLAWMLIAVLSISPKTTFSRLEVSLLTE